MGTALWIVWEVARAAGIPLALGYAFGRWTARKDAERERQGRH